MCAAPDRPPPSRRCAAIATKGLAAYHRFNWSHLGLFKDINRSFFVCNWERYYLYTWSWIIDNRPGGTYRDIGNSSPITFGRYIYKFQSLNRLAQIWLENVPPACIKHPDRLWTRPTMYEHLINTIDAKTLPYLISKSIIRITLMMTKYNL